MSDLAATNCGCEGTNGCSLLWIIILLSLLGCGNNNGILGGNNCGNGDSCCWIILLLLFCGGNNGILGGNSNGCGCGC